MSLRILFCTIRLTQFCCFDRNYLEMFVHIALIAAHSAPKPKKTVSLNYILLHFDFTSINKHISTW